MMDFSLKVGFGASPRTGPLTLDDSIDQIRSEKSQVGIKTAKSSVENWPQDLTFDLQQRVQAARDFRTQEEEIYEQKNLSGSERRSKREVLKRQANIWHYDQLRLIHQAIYGEDPVRQRFMQFWWNHFTVGATNGSNFYTGDLYWNVIGEGISGSFNELVYAVTRHPAMLTYLDNIYSVGEKSPKALDARKNPQKKLHVGLNDNLARELLELHTVTPAANYTEADIHDAAKILSGWGFIFNKQKDASWAEKTAGKKYDDAFIKYHHEPGDKFVLGKKYSKGFSSGKKTLKSLTDDLSTHPKTIDHLCQKLCQHFISETPSTDDIDYVRKIWIKSKGHLPDIHQAVLEKAKAAESPGRLQWPLTWSLSLVRSSGATLFPGWEDMKSHPAFDANGCRLYREIGQDFWSRRQPNGFSSGANDWISLEHMDRRVRIASLIANIGSPQFGTEEILSQLSHMDPVRNLISQGTNEIEKFVLMACSQSFMGYSA